MKAQIIQVVDGDEYPYGTYPFETDAEKNRVNEIAAWLRKTGGIEVYVKEI